MIVYTHDLQPYNINARFDSHIFVFASSASFFLLKNGIYSIKYTANTLLILLEISTPNFSYIYRLYLFLLPPLDMGEKKFQLSPFLYFLPYTTLPTCSGNALSSLFLYLLSLFANCTLIFLQLNFNAYFHNIISLYNFILFNRLLFMKYHPSSAQNTFFIVVVKLLVIFTSYPHYIFSSHRL